MPLGYKAIPASDPKEQQLREAWHLKRGEWAAEGFPTASNTKRAFDLADERLTRYLWQRTEADIAEDRRKHPKARRNLPPIAVGGHGRHLP